MIEQVAVGGYDDNFSYVVHDGEKAAIVDPAGDIEKVFAVIEEKDLDIIAVLLTHSHFDHHDKLEECLERFNVPVYMHENAISLIRTNKRIDKLKNRRITAIISSLKANLFTTFLLFIIFLPNFIVQSGKNNATRLSIKKRIPSIIKTSEKLVRRSAIDNLNFL